MEGEGWEEDGRVEGGREKRERERSREERKRRAEPCFREAPALSPRRPCKLCAVHSQAERGWLELC